MPSGGSTLRSTRRVSAETASSSTAVRKMLKASLKNCTFSCCGAYTESRVNAFPRSRIASSAEPTAYGAMKADNNRLVAVTSRPSAVW